MEDAIRALRRRGAGGGAAQRHDAELDESVGFLTFPHRVAELRPGWGHDPFSTAPSECVVGSCEGSLTVVAEAPPDLVSFVGVELVRVAQ